MNVDNVREILVQVKDRTVLFRQATLIGLLDIHGLIVVTHKERLVSEKKKPRWNVGDQGDVRGAFQRMESCIAIRKTEQLGRSNQGEQTEMTV